MPDSPWTVGAGTHFATAELIGLPQPTYMQKARKSPGFLHGRGDRT